MHRSRSKSTARICGRSPIGCWARLSEADDAVQEAWLRMDRADIRDVRNLRGWLTTVVAQICLDMLRARNVRPEEPLERSRRDRSARRRRRPRSRGGAGRLDRGGPDRHTSDAVTGRAAGVRAARHVRPAVRRNRPDRRADRRTPPRSSRPGPGAGYAGKHPARQPISVRQRRLVDAFLAAARDGDFDALLAVLDSEVVLRVDAAAAGVADHDPRRARGRHQCARLRGQRPLRRHRAWWTARSASSSRPRAG